MENTKKELVEKLEAFKKAFNELSNTWTEASPSDAEALNNTLYPFPFSFNDLQGEVNSWVAASVNSILLEDKIYNALISMPEMGLGEMGACREEAERLTVEKSNEEYFLQDKSGRGFSTTRSFGELMALDLAQTDENEVSLIEWIQNNEVGDEFITVDALKIIRTK